jgi:hypothetical protein
MDIQQNGRVFKVMVKNPKGITLDNILAMIKPLRPIDGKPITVKINSPKPLVNFNNFRSPTEHHPGYNQIFYVTNFRRSWLQRRLEGRYPMTKSRRATPARGSTS